MTLRLRGSENRIIELLSGALFETDVITFVTAGST